MTKRMLAYSHVGAGRRTGELRWPRPRIVWLFRLDVEMHPGCTLTYTAPLCLRLVRYGSCVTSGEQRGATRTASGGNERCNRTERTPVTRRDATTGPAHGPRMYIDSLPCVVRWSDCRECLAPACRAFCACGVRVSRVCATHADHVRGHISTNGRGTARAGRRTGTPNRRQPNVAGKTSTGGTRYRYAIIPV